MTQPKQDLPPPTPDQKIRRGLYLVLDVVKDFPEHRKAIADLIETAPAPVIGRQPTPDEIQLQQIFKAKARALLRTLPPELGISYQSMLLQVASANAKKTKSLQSPVLSPTSKKKNKVKSPSPRKSKKQPPSQQEMKNTSLVDFICILNMVPTLPEDGQPTPRPQEIIELPALLLSVQTGAIVDTFHRYVLPDVHPDLSQACIEQTGIPQDLLDEQGIPLTTALQELADWFRWHGLVSVPEALMQNKQKAVRMQQQQLQQQQQQFPSFLPLTDNEDNINGGDNDNRTSSPVRPAPRTQSTFLFAITGDWDLKVCLPNQMEYHGWEVPLMFQSWVNIKWPFETMYHKTRVNGMEEMLQILQIEPQWIDGNGLDVCRCMAQVCHTMIQRGWVPNPSAGMGRMGSRAFWDVQRHRPWPKQRDPVSPYKMVYLIRNGEMRSESKNNNSNGGDPDDSSARTTSLSERGLQQARDLSEIMEENCRASIQLVVSAPDESSVHTSLVGFRDHSILVDYDLFCVFPDTSMDTILDDLRDELEERPSYAPFDSTTLLNRVAPTKESASQRLQRAMEWLYMERKEKTLAIVCPYTVIRTAVHGTAMPLSPDFATPIKCQLFMSGKLVPV